MNTNNQHITFEDLLALNSGRLDLQKVNQCLRHLETCEECQNTLEAIQEFNNIELRKPHIEYAEKQLEEELVNTAKQHIKKYQKGRYIRLLKSHFYQHRWKYVMAVAASWLLILFVQITYNQAIEYYSKGKGTPDSSEHNNTMHWATHEVFLPDINIESSEVIKDNKASFFPDSIGFIDNVLTIAAIDEKVPLFDSTKTRSSVSSCDTNEIYSGIPPEIGNLSCLENLPLHNNALSAGVSNFNSLPNLYSIDSNYYIDIQNIAWPNFNPKDFYEDMNGDGYPSVVFGDSIISISLGYQGEKSTIIRRNDSLQNQPIQRNYKPETDCLKNLPTDKKSLAPQKEPTDKSY